MAVLVSKIDNYTQIMIQIHAYVPTTYTIRTINVSMNTNTQRISQIQADF